MTGAKPGTGTGRAEMLSSLRVVFFDARREAFSAALDLGPLEEMPAPAYRSMNGSLS